MPMFPEMTAIAEKIKVGQIVHVWGKPKKVTRIYPPTPEKDFYGFRVQTFDELGRPNGFAGLDANQLDECVAAAKAAEH